MANHIQHSRVIDAIVYDHCQVSTIFACNDRLKALFIKALCDQFGMHADDSEEIEGLVLRKLKLIDGENE